MTIAPERELEELDFEPTPAVVVGPICFNPAPEPVQFTCWDCDAPHGGPAGRCNSCATVFGQRLAARSSVIAPAPTREWADETLEQARRLAQLRRYEERSRYCSPTRYQRLTNSYNGTLARDYERRDRQDALHARRLEAEYHDRLVRELMAESHLSMTAHSWVPSDDSSCGCPACTAPVDAPGGGGGRLLAGLVGSCVGLIMGVLLALLVVL
jgi:hypothetical protein